MTNKTINTTVNNNLNNLNNERNVTMENDMLPAPPAEIKLEETNTLLTPREISIAIIHSLIDELKGISYDNGGWYDFSTTIKILNIKVGVLDEIMNHWKEVEIPSADFFMNLLNKIEQEASFDYDKKEHNEKIRKLELRFWNQLEF